MSGASCGIYIHIPFCKSKCKYCAFVSVTDFSLQHRYVNALIDEMRVAPEQGCNVDTVYIGGGTPSCLFDGGISEIIKTVRENYSLARDAEITVECNPESVDVRFAEECKDNGVNRISIGLQSSCDRALKAIGRLHNKDKFINAVELLSKYFDNISSDIILGLPEQTACDVEQSIELITKYCSHVSVYALSIEENTPLFEIGYQCDDDIIADFYDLAYTLLKDKGFERYEVSNFSKNGKQSKHNKKYWTCEPYLGFGVAAHGYDGNIKRYCHSENIEDYIRISNRKYTVLSDVDKYNEYVMLRMRTENGIDLDAFVNKFGFDFVEKNKKTIKKLLSDRVVILSDNSFKIAPERMFVMNGIIEELMI